MSSELPLHNSSVSLVTTSSCVCVFLTLSSYYSIRLHSSCSDVCRSACATRLSASTSSKDATLRSSLSLSLPFTIHLVPPLAPSTFLHYLLHTLFFFLVPTRKSREKQTNHMCVRGWRQTRPGKFLCTELLCFVRFFRSTTF